MKLSKKLLAIGLSVGLVVSTALPVFAWNTEDPLAGLHTIFDSIKDKTYTATEKAEIMAYAEGVVNAWDDVIYADGILKLKDTSGRYWAVSTTPGNWIGNGSTTTNGVTYDTYNGIYTPSNWNELLVATSRLDDYEDKMYSDFEALFHKLHFDALGRNRVFNIYEKEDTNVTNIGDTLVELTVYDLLDMWTHEGSLLDALRNALSLAKTKAADAATTTPSTTTPTTTNCVTCNTTTTTTTTTTAGTANAGTGNAARPAAGLPLANTATNYGNVMALGLGAMVVALGVFAYSKKVTA